MTIADIIKDNRPHLSASSIRTYTSIISNLIKAMGEGVDVSTLQANPSKVVAHLKDMDAKRRKTIYSALVVLCEKTDGKACETYRNAMMDDAEVSSKQAKRQQMTEDEKGKWMSLEQVHKKVEQLAAEAKPLMVKDELTMFELQRIQGYIIAALMFGKYIPPRRLLDWVALSRTVDKDNKTNYIQGKNLVFNVYKTARTYGQQRVEMPVKLQNIIKKWLKLTNGISEWVLFDINANQMTVSQLNTRIGKILGNGAGINIIRHIYVSDKVLANAPLLEELEEVAADMGHSLMEQQLYRRVEKKPVKK